MVADNPRATTSVVAPGWTGLTRLLAFVLPAVIASDFPLMAGVSAGAVLSLGLTPVWLPHVRGVSGVRMLLAAVALCCGSGVLLAWWSSASHAVDVRALVLTVVMLVGTVASAGALIWCARIHSVALVATVFGVGMFAAINTAGRFTEEPWRFGFAMPVTVLVLGLCMLLKRTWLELAAVAILMSVNAFSGGRSSSAMMLMVGALVLWQHRPQFRRRSSSALGALALVGLLGLGVYRALTGAAMEGYLGDSAQERTQAQIEQSGSLILGGRPESGATMALIDHRPLGYGPGVAPTLEDILVAKRGMAELGYDPNNGYVEEYMFGRGGHIELHSLIGDLWAPYGLAGLLLAGVLLSLALRYIGMSLAYRSGTALGLFLSLRVCWDVLFSPVVSTVDHLTLALAVMLLVRREPHQRPVDADVAIDRRAPVATREVGRHARQRVGSF